MPFAARGIAYCVVRANCGTIGGSLAHADPAADWLTTTIAMDASLRLGSSRAQIKVADFVTGAMGPRSRMEATSGSGSRQRRHGAMPSTPRSLAILLNP
jgi:carbon-monoxide dehydrogenase medium subunit